MPIAIEVGARDTVIGKQEWRGDNLVIGKERRHGAGGDQRGLHQAPGLRLPGRFNLGAKLPVSKDLNVDVSTGRGFEYRLEVFHGRMHFVVAQILGRQMADHHGVLCRVRRHQHGAGNQRKA